MRLTICAAAIGLALIPASLAASETLTRPDGSTIHYRFDLPAGPAKGMILIAQGSGCAPTGANPALGVIRAAFADYAALTVEKAGVAPDAAIADGFADCPQAFHASYTLSGRIADYRAVLQQVRADHAQLREQPLLLFGGSEGGMAVAQLAATEAPAATMILSSGTGMSLEDIILSTLPAEGKAAVGAGFAAARADPQGQTLFAGSTHRFWADSLDQRALDALMAVETPILIIQGGLDRSSPPATSRPTLEAFATAGKCNLTYVEFAGLDHGMLAPDGGTHLDTVAALAARWAQEPVGAC